MIWLVLGFACGLLLPRAATRISDSQQTGGPERRERAGKEIEPVLSPHRQTSGAVGERRITAEQLMKLATQTGQLPTLDVIVSALQRQPRIEGAEPVRRETLLDNCLLETCQSLDFKPHEAKKLRDLFMSAVDRLIDLETTSLPIRVTGPGKMMLDFDTLTDRQEPIVDELRTGIRKSLGQRALDDLNTLAGLDEFLGSEEKSRNIEIHIERDDDFLITWIFVPGPGGREGSMTTNPATMPYREVVKQSLESLSPDRFTHLMERLTDSLTPPP